MHKLLMKFMSFKYNIWNSAGTVKYGFLYIKIPYNL